MTTGEATSHSTGLQKTTTKWLVMTQQKALHSHLTKLANYANQVIDETTSHLTKAASCQVIGYGYSGGMFCGLVNYWRLDYRAGARYPSCHAENELPALVGAEVGIMTVIPGSLMR